MQKITPFLWFDEQAEEAVGFYTSIFKNSRIGDVARFGDDVPGPKGKVMTINFQLAGQNFIALNGGPEFSFTPAVSFYVSCETEEEVAVLWQRLLEGGTALMELAEYPFSKKYGWVMDRFGVSWQISLSGTPQRISPFLMFVGSQHGRAEEAVQYYTAIFEDSSVAHLERYSKGMGGPEGTLMHGSFLLAGQEFMAIDSSFEHQFSFTHAISFNVDCKDQAEVDYYWDRLSAGGELEQCGWLRDKFGVSWQIVPSILNELVSDPDPVKAGRVTQAMLKMVKLDISLLQQAYDQG